MPCCQIRILLQQITFMFFLVFHQDNNYVVDESYLDRFNNLDIDASLKLSFMGGMVSVSGSAKYLEDRALTENTVSTTLKYVLHE